MREFERVLGLPHEWGWLLGPSGGRCDVCFGWRRPGLFDTSFTFSLNFVGKFLGFVEAGSHVPVVLTC